MRTQAGRRTCARCGTAISGDDLLCDRCREEELAPVPTRAPAALSEQEERARRWPPSMAKPSSVQYHATVMAVVFLVLLGLGVFAFLSHRGVGPFTGAAREFTFTGQSLEVSGVVRNEGSKRSRANCRAVAATSTDAQLGTGRFLTSMIEPGGEVGFHTTIVDIEVEPAKVLVFCR